MSIVPTSIPRWATVGSGIVEPTDAKKALGWGATGMSGERPPAQYFNWHMNAVGEWIKYLSYRPIVNDDFIGYINPNNQGTGLAYQGNSGLSGIVGPWFAAASGGVFLDAGIYEPGGGVGLAVIGTPVGLQGNPQSQKGPTGVFYAAAGPVSTGGFLFDARVRSVHVANGEEHSIGMLNEIWFTASSATGNWWFSWAPSGIVATSIGCNPTSIDTGVAVGASNVYQRLTFERVGATLIAEVDHLRVAVVSLPWPFGTTSATGRQMGSRVGVHVNKVGPQLGAMYVDSIFFGLR